MAGLVLTILNYEYNLTVHPDDYLYTNSVNKVTMWKKLYRDYNNEVRGIVAGLSLGAIGNFKIIIFIA